jgi:hypothetical protein
LISTFPKKRQIGVSSDVNGATRFEEGWFRGAFSPVAKPTGPSVNARRREIGRRAFRGPGDEKEPPAKGGRLKFFGAKNWTITQADPDTGAVVFHHGGTFTLEGDKFSEKIEYANDNTKDLIGKSLHFTIKVEDDKLTQQGIDNSFNEVWKRVK